MFKDILLDDTGDLRIENGDFVVGESDAQHLMLIVNLMAGSIKQFPLQGVGIMQYSGSSGQAQTVRREIKVKAEADGYSNVTVDLLQDENGVFQYNVDAVRS